MGPAVSQSKDITVFSDGSEDAQQKSLGVADFPVRHVATEVYQIEYAVYVERRRSHAIDFVLDSHFASEPHEFR